MIEIRWTGCVPGMSVATIGKSIHIKGDVKGEEDMEIDGEVEGQVTLSSHQLTIGAHGQVKGELNAKSIVVVGQVSGNLIATERAEWVRMTHLTEDTALLAAAANAELMGFVGATAAEATRFDGLELSYDATRKIGRLKSFLSLP